MIRYKDIGNDSGIVAYENGSDCITIQFNDGGVYHYSYSSVGKADVDRMKQLAEIGIISNETYKEIQTKQFIRGHVAQSSYMK